MTSTILLFTYKPLSLKTLTSSPPHRASRSVRLVGRSCCSCANGGSSRGQEAHEHLQQGSQLALCSRRDGLIGAGAFLTLLGVDATVDTPPAHADVDFLLFEGGSGKLSPISCTQPKNPTRAAPRGSVITAPNNYEFVNPCPLGGYTLDTSWSFWGPSALQPLTGFQVGALTSGRGLSPDPSGALDARFESEFGIVLVSGLPERATDPWIRKENIEDAGSMEEVLDALNPQLSRSLVRSFADTVKLPGDSDPRGTSYYTYEFNNTSTSFANRRIIKIGIAGGKLVAIDARCNEKQWGKSEGILKPLVASFRFGTTPASKPREGGSW